MANWNSSQPPRYSCHVPSFQACNGLGFQFASLLCHSLSRALFNYLFIIKSIEGLELPITIFNPKIETFFDLYSFFFQMGGVSFCLHCLELNWFSVKGRILKDLFHDGGFRWKIMDLSDSQTALLRICSTWAVLSFAGSHILHLTLCGVWSSDGKWALHLKQWTESFRASVLNCKRDGNKLPPKCPFISLWAYSQFSMKKALSDVPFWFRYGFFWWFFFFLLPWFAFPVPFHEGILIFPFSNGTFVIFVLLHVPRASFFGGVRSNADFLLHLI